MKKYNIGILTFPISEAGNIPLSNLVDILFSFSNDLYLITGNDGYRFFKEDKRIHAYEIRHKGSSNIFNTIIQYIYTQLKMSHKLIKLSRNVDMWIFTVGGDSLVLPMLTAKLLKKDVILALAGSSIKTLISANNNLFKPLKILSMINYTLSNRIIVYSEDFINEWNLERYKNKIYIAHRHFVYFDKFAITNKIDDRENLVGYIGRLSEEKGVLNFIKAIPEISEKHNWIKFIVGGDGQLRDKIEKYLVEENLNSKVKLTGWIPHDELPKYLNKLKLIVIPSYTEAGPLILFEAMACGTPILAAQVGEVPDVIKDGETGFILENNLPEHIAKKVISAINHPNLDKIADNARKLVEEEKFTYEAAVERYRKILENI